MEAPDESIGSSDKVCAVARSIEGQLESLPPEERERAARIIFAESSFNGPIPSPEMLKRYGEVLPGLEDRLVAAWEDETKHRRAIEIREHDFRDKAFGSQVTLTEKAQKHAFLLVLVIFVGALVLGLYGHEWLAGVMATTTVLSVLSVYILGKLPQRDRTGQDPDGANPQD